MVIKLFYYRYVNCELFAQNVYRQTDRQTTDVAQLY